MGTATPVAAQQQDEQRRALDIARALASWGVPIFLAPHVGESGRGVVAGYRLPSGWQHTTADPTVLDGWRPGMAVCAVAGHHVDVIDVDPRNGGNDSLAELSATGLVPGVIVATADTPSGGSHGFVNRLGVRSLDGFRPGVDIKAGTNGEGHGFVFLAPTVKASKVTGELAAYRWTNIDLTRIDRDDLSGAALAEAIAAHRQEKSAEQRPQAPQGADDGPAWVDLDEQTQQRVAAYLERIVTDETAELEQVARWPENQRDAHGRGWEKIIADLAHRLGSLERAAWTPNSWSGLAALQQVVPTPMAAAVDPSTKYREQRDRGTPAPFPAALAQPRITLDDMAGGSLPAAAVQRRADDEAPASGNGDLHSGQVRMAHRLAAAYRGRLLYVHNLGWLRYDGRRWVEDDKGHGGRAVLEVLEQALIESFRTGDDALRKDVAKCESDSGIKGVLGVASSLVEFAATIDDLDSDPYLLNVQNGTLDLRTGQLRPHDPADLITKVTAGAYDPGASSPAWTTFLEQILPDAEERAYLQRVVGQALAGVVTEHMLPILVGTGRNGKGVFYGAVRHALGSYAAIIDPSLLMARKHEGSTTELVELRGARLVVGSETQEGRKLDEATMKRLTGGDPLTARRLYREPITWEPTHTLVYVTNHLPQVAANDPAVWARVRVIPFNVVIPEDRRDKKLLQRLTAEADAILSWAIEGYAAHSAIGMQAPQTVLRATEAYRTTVDAVARFVAEACFVSPAASSRTRELYSAWQPWAIEDGAEPMTEKAFAKELDRLGYPAGQRTNAGVVRKGLMPLNRDDS